MSYQPLWLRDLVAYSIQAAALVGVGTIMASLLRLRLPRVRHAYWQALLAVCVFLPLLQPWRPEIVESSGTALSNITFAAPSAVAAPAGPSLAQIVLLLICAGVVLRALWMAMGLGRLCIYRRHAQRMDPVPQAVEEAQRFAPVFPALFISRQLPTPATFGFFRPTILFPARFLEMEPAMQKAIALHELLHVERRDWLWNMFEEVVLTLLWFHLPLWWVVRSARLSREQAVDAEAVRRSNARRPYLKALLEMAGQKMLAESLPAPLFLRESQLAERVALMMKEVHMSRTRLTLSILTAACTLLLAGMSLAWAFPLKTSAQQAESTVSSTSDSPEGKVITTESPGGNALVAEGRSTQEKTKIYEVGGKVKAPKPIYVSQPPYTEPAREAHLSGIVELWVVIDSDGRVVSVEERSKPLGKGLDESAADTVRTWKFKPATRNGIPVPVQIVIKISFRYHKNKKSHPVSPRPSAMADPPAQAKQKRSEAAKDNGPSVNINQPELQRQIEEAVKQAKNAQENIAKIDQANIQKLVNEAMKQAKTAQEAASKIDQEEIKRQVEEAMKQLGTMNTPQMRLKTQEQMKQLEELNTPGMKERLKQALDQAKIAQGAAAKVNKAEIQRQLQQAKKQIEQALQEAQAARKEARKEQENMKPGQAEIQRQAEHFRKRAEAFRKQAEKMRENMEKERLEQEKQRNAAEPAPSPQLKSVPRAPSAVAPPPAPILPSPESMSPPPAPSAIPVPPPTPQNP